MLRKVANVRSIQIVRSMATEAPVRLHGLDGRYATSLWRVASEKGELAKVDADLASFTSHSKLPAVQQLCNNPSIPKIAKKQAVADFLKVCGYTDTTKNMFSVLAENGRLNQTGNIINKFQELQRAAKGEVEVEVILADEISADQKKAVVKALSSEKFAPKGAKLSIQYKIQPEILGGLVINIGDKHINMSVLSRVNQMHNLLMQPI